MRGLPDAEQGEQSCFPRTGDAVVNETGKRIPPSRPPHPRGHQPSSEHDLHPGKFLFEEADHREGAERLAQIVQGEADELCFLYTCLPALEHSFASLGPWR